MSYSESLRLEGEFWGSKACAASPDFRRWPRADDPQDLWDDPEIEDLVRGRYKQRLMHPAAAGKLRVFEIGCGNGWMALELARQGHQVDARDISPQGIEFARAYYQKVAQEEGALGSVDYAVCDLNTAEFPPRTYDLVICWDSLHHILKARRLIRQACASLVPGGRCLVFDHIGQRCAAVAFLDQMAVYLLRALFQPRAFFRAIGRKIRSKLFRAASDSSGAGLPCSPFEDVTGREMIDYFAEVFGPENVAVETTLVFGARWLARMRGPRWLRLKTVELVKRVNEALIRAGLAEGEYVFIEAVKTPCRAGSGPSASATERASCSDERTQGLRQGDLSRDGRRDPASNSAQAVLRLA